MVTRSLNIFFIVAALSFVPAPVRADAIVPGAFAAVDGNTNNVFPFGASTNGFRYQQVYAAAEFGPAAIWIDAILFRPERGGVGPFVKSFAAVQLNLSTTSVAPDGLSTTFAANVGADNTMVRSGPLTLSSLDVAGPGNTRAFDILIPFALPFLYNPTLGNLLIDFRVSGTTVSAKPFDAQLTAGDSVSRRYALDANALVGLSGDTLGLVTQFQTQAVNAVPDMSSSLPLFTMAIGAIVAAQRRMMSV